MIKIPLLHNRFAIVDDEFSHFANYKWYCGSKNYVVRNFRLIPGRGNQRHIRLHHCIMGYPTNGLQVDHIDRNPLNNQRSNLRFVTTRKNNHNRLVEKTSQFIGVHWFKRDQRWRAAITVNRKGKHLGYFDDERDAHRVYLNALAKLGGDK